MGRVVLMMEITKKQNKAMTKEQFNQVMGNYANVLAKVKASMAKAQQSFIEDYPIKDGDKCVDGNGRECWFKRIQFDDITSCTPLIYVNYPKKDGVRSNRDQHCFVGITKIEED